MGHNELLIRDALKGRDRGDVVISVKCGALRDPKGNVKGALDLGVYHVLHKPFEMHDLKVLLEEACNSGHL